MMEKQYVTLQTQIASETKNSSSGKISHKKPEEIEKRDVLGIYAKF